VAGCLHYGNVTHGLGIGKIIFNGICNLQGMHHLNIKINTSDKYNFNVCVTFAMYRGPTQIYRANWVNVQNKIYVVQ
jgi:hypothetical protein